MSGFGQFNGLEVLDRKKNIHKKNKTNVFIIEEVEYLV